MENYTKQSRPGFATVIRSHRKKLIYVGVLLLLTLLFHLFRPNRAVMNFMTDAVAHPVRRLIARICSVTPWSVAEWMLIAAAIFAVGFLLFFVISLVHGRRNFFVALYKNLLRAAAVVLSVSSLMTLLWNVNYYADSFEDKSGILAGESSVETLEKTTALFARLASASAKKVRRDENGRYAEDVGAIFDLSPTLFLDIEDEFPFLSGPPLRAKKVLFSCAMSYLNTTGVAFPFTGEANINTDQPAFSIPFTIAHEIAHQRKVASEQEANFVAVLACIESKDAAYEYSGYLAAYRYLANALSREAPERLDIIDALLSDEIKCDLTESYAYWRQFEGKISELSDSLYDGYLKGQGQSLGTKSYGAVVDLLIARYGE